MFKNMTLKIEEESQRMIILCTYKDKSCAIPEGHPWFSRCKAAIDAGQTEARL